MTPDEAQALAGMADDLPDDVAKALLRGDGEVIARHLREALRDGRSPHRMVIVTLANMLDPKSPNETWQLIFERRRAGNPAVDVREDAKAASIYHAVEDEYKRLGNKRGSRKVAIGNIAQRFGLEDRTVRAHWEKLSKISKR